VNEAPALIERFPDSTTYRALRVAAGMSPKTAEAAERGLENTLYGVSLRHGADTIGMGRIVGDGGCFFLVVDIAVLPAWQGRGLGTRIMAALDAWLRTNAPVSAYVSLGPVNAIWVHCVANSEARSQARGAQRLTGRQVKRPAPASEPLKRNPSGANTAVAPRRHRSVMDRHPFPPSPLLRGGGVGAQRTQIALAGPRRRRRRQALVRKIRFRRNRAGHGQHGLRGARGTEFWITPSCGLAMREAFMPGLSPTRPTTRRPSLR
jgi:GNAT superfamily N-acetyltransferase